MTTVLLLSRRPLSTGSVLGAALALLRDRGIEVVVEVVPTEAPLSSPLPTADLVVLRDAPPAVLQALDASPHRVRSCNSPAATAAAADKAEADRRLRSAGVPVPRSFVSDTWAEVLTRTAGSAVAVKPTRGRDGSGVLLCDDATALPDAAPYPGPWLVQDLVPGDGVDRKLYVIDEDVFGVLRRWPPRTAEDKRGRAFEPSDVERSVARAAGDAFGLEVFGIDVVGSPGEPVVVDVNPMPGFKGVTGAEHRLAEHFASHVSEGVPSCRS